MIRCRAENGKSKIINFENDFPGFRLRGVVFFDLYFTKTFYLGEARKTAFVRVVSENDRRRANSGNFIALPQARVATAPRFVDRTARRLFKRFSRTAFRRGGDRFRRDRCRLVFATFGSRARSLGNPAFEPNAFR